MSRVKAIAFSDTAHKAYKHLPLPAQNWLGKVSCNWVKSSAPLDTIEHTLRVSRTGTVCISAGHANHEWTSTTSFPSIFPFFEQMRGGRNPYTDSPAPSRPRRRGSVARRRGISRGRR